MFWRLAVVVSIVLFSFFNWFQPASIGNEYAIIIKVPGLILYCLQFFLLVNIIYLLEYTYRWAETYQKRIGRLVLISLNIIAVFQTVFIIRSIIFKIITKNYAETLIIVYGICFPIILFSLLRYRLWNEKISISRDSIYTSITLFIIGAVLLGLGFTVYLFRQFRLIFTYFELFLIVFTLAFFLILIASSGRMRVMLVRFLSVRIFKHKYDYREQFFILHQAYISDSNMQQSFTEIIENMKYSVTVDDAYIFISNSENGNYYIHKNPEFATHKELWFSGDSQFVKAFATDTSYLDFAYSSENEREKKVLESERQIIHSLDIAAAFPILYNENLLGLLALNHSLGKKFDYEDIQLIQIFSLSIGNLIFKHKMLKTSIEQKQFESFNHIASFIIHDIKNQVATLSLITKNSKANINNPEFQKSLLNSLNGCVSNLQALLDKFSAPLKKEEINWKIENINSIIEKVLDASGIKAIGRVLVECNFEFENLIQTDATHLYYIIMNLIKNALEAMNYSGKININTGQVNGNINKLSKEFQVSEKFLSDMKAYIKVTDNGCGMSKKFINEKLFLPFTSTKDKGIGIGLYQCKILIEKMGGKLICQSEIRNGTKFCIVLK